MVTVCNSRTYYLLVALILAGSSLLADDSHSQNRSSVETNARPNDRVQQLLSDRQDDEEAVGSIFELGNGALPPLVGALREGRQVERASRALAYLGGPEERKTLREAIGTEKNRERKSLISSLLAGALVEPASQEEWDFLRTCVEGYKSDVEDFVSLSAALALGTNATPQALHLLQSAGPIDESRLSDKETEKEIAKAIRWIKQRSLSKASSSTEARSDPEQIKKIVLENAFYADGERELLSVEEIAFTRDKSRALASVEIYRGPKDARGYDIVLLKSSGTWKIVGVWFSWVA
jgi:hypothetical protein